MKRTLTTLCVMAMAIAIFASCYPLEEKSFSSEAEYSIDIDKFASQNFFTMSQDGGYIDIQVVSPFEVTVIGGNNFSAKRNGNNIRLSVDNNDNYTREIEAYVQNFTANQSIKNWGFFYYPVIIRQEGPEGIRYLKKDELESLKNTREARWNNDSYILGIVKSISPIYSCAGILRQPGNIPDYYDFPICSRLSSDQTKPYDLEATDIVVESEGVQLTIQTAWAKAYKLVSNMKVKVGDTVEIYANKKGVQNELDKDLIVCPLSVVVK